jgi:hypothetical protein
LYFIFNTRGWTQFFIEDKVQAKDFCKNDEPTALNHRIEVTGRFKTAAGNVFTENTMPPPKTQKISNQDYPPLNEFATYNGRKELPDMLVVRCGQSKSHFVYEPFISGLVIQNDEIDGVGIPTPNPLQVPSVERVNNTYGTIPMSITYDALTNQGLTCRSRNIIKDPTAIKSALFITDRSGIKRRHLTNTYGKRRARILAETTRAAALKGGITAKNTNWIGKEYAYMNFEHTKANGSNRSELMPPNIRGPKINAWSPYRIISSNVNEARNQNGMLKDSEIFYMISPSVYFGLNARYDKVPNFWSNLSLYDI